MVDYIIYFFISLCLTGFYLFLKKSAAFLLCGATSGRGANSGNLKIIVKRFIFPEAKISSLN